MTAQEEDLVALYDKAPLNARYWISMVLAVMTSIFDFFDFFIVGFLVAVLAPHPQTANATSREPIAPVVLRAPSTMPRIIAASRPGSAQRSSGWRSS